MTTSTPWGAAQTTERYIPGITWYSTSSMAGFKAVGETKGGLLAWQLLPATMPAAFNLQPQGKLL